MNLEIIPKSVFTKNLKEFLQIQIRNKYERTVDFAEILDGEIAKGTIYGIFDNKTEINITMYTLHQICKALDMTCVDFVHKFEIFLLEKRYIDKVS